MDWCRVGAVVQWPAGMGGLTYCSQRRAYGWCWTRWELPVGLCTRPELLKYLPVTILGELLLTALVNAKHLLVSLHLGDSWANISKQPVSFFGFKSISSCMQTLQVQNARLASWTRWLCWWLFMFWGSRRPSRNRTDIFRQLGYW